MYLCFSAICWHQDSPISFDGKTFKLCCFKHRSFTWVLASRSFFQVEQCHWEGKLCLYILRNIICSIRTSNVCYTVPPICIFWWLTCFLLFFFLNFYFPLLSQSIVYILILVAGNGIVIYVMMQVIEAQADMPILGAVTLYSSLLTFTLHVHPDRLDYADQVLVCIYWNYFLNMYCVCLVNWITMRQLFKFTGICLCVCVCYHHCEEIDVWSSIVFKLKIKCAGYPYKERTDVPFYLCLSEWFNIIFYFCLSFFQYEGYVAFFRDKIYFVRAKLIFVWTILQGACVKKLSGEGKLEDNRATKQIVALLSAPLDKYNDIVTVLKLSNYPSVMEYVDSETNKVMAMVIIQSIMKNNTQISTADKVGFCPLYIYIHISSYALF